MIVSVFLNAIFVLFSVILLIGLIKPSTVIRWKKNPNRSEFLAYWLLGVILIIIIYTTAKGMDIQHIDKGEAQMEQGNYSQATSILENVDQKSKYYSKAQNLLMKIDSIKISESKAQIERGFYVTANSKVESIDKESIYYSEAKKILKDVDSLKRLHKQKKIKRTAEEENRKIKKQIVQELSSINEGIDFSSYRGSIEALQNEIILFQKWSRLCRRGRRTRDKEIMSMAKTLRSKAINIQLKEFPKLRSECAKELSKVMWEDDIDVYANWTDNRHINFTGGWFAANKKKKDFHMKVQKTLKTFRFSKASYRWYTGDSDYTYFSIYEGKDTDLISE